MTYLPLVGYTILLRDLLAPLVEVVLDKELGGQARNMMVSALVVLVRLLRFWHSNVVRAGACHTVARFVTSQKMNHKQAATARNSDSPVFRGTAST